MTSPSAARSARRRWLLALFGPIVWYLHFWFVYLLAETGCELGTAAQPVWLEPVILVATVVTIAAIGLSCVMTWRLLRRRLGDSIEPFLGLGLGALFAVAVALVGLPVLTLSPC